MGQPRIEWTARFGKDFKRLDPHNKKRVLKALKQFATDLRYPGLNFEPVVNQEGYFTIRVGLKLRIFMQCCEDEQGLFFDLEHIGSHDLYRPK